MTLGTTFTLDGLGLTQADVERVQAADRRARGDLVKRQQIDHSGGTFTVGRDSYASLVDDILARAGQNEVLLETSTRPLRGTQKIVLRTAGSGGGGTSTRQPQRKSNEEHELIGFFGEMIAFKWLKEKYGERRVIDGPAGSRFIARTSMAAPAATRSAMTSRSTLESINGFSR